MNEFNPKNDAEILKRLKSGIGGSNVTASSINGNVLVNNEEVTVYDDTKIKERISPLEALKFRTMVGEELDYALLTVVEDSNFIPKAYTVIPFCVVVSANGIDVNKEKYSVRLKSGKTYSLQAYIRIGQVARWEYFHFYDLTHSTPIGFDGCSEHNGSAWATSSTANAIFTPTEDCDVCVMFADVDSNNTKCLLQSGTTFMKIEEIGRTYIHDPVKSVNDKDGIEDTPVGHIISFMGKTAPKHYLICDGKIYNITDYPKLAEFIEKEFGVVNYFGGDGITTFAVPDLIKDKENSVNWSCDDKYLIDSSGEFCSIMGRKYYKENNLIALNAVVIGTYGTYPYLVSTVKEAVKMHSSYDSSRIEDSRASFEYKGFEWYISMSEYGFSGNNTVNGDIQVISAPTIDTFAFVDIGKLIIDSANVSNSTIAMQCIKYEPTYCMEYHPKYGYMKSTLLFNGNATNGDYYLIDDINNYDFLIVYACITHANGFDMYDTTSTIITKECYNDIQSYSIGSYWGKIDGEILSYALEYYIKDNMLHVNGFKQEESKLWVNPRIKKVVGIKCTEKTLGSTGSSEDQNLTDEEINTLITNSFIKEGE